MTVRKNFEEEWEWFLKRINFGNSALDARAIRFMNEFSRYLDSIEAEAIELGKKAIK